MLLCQYGRFESLLRWNSVGMGPIPIEQMDESQAEILIIFE